VKYSPNRSWLALLLLAAGWTTPALRSQNGPAQSAEPALLEPGKTIERQLAGGQSHEYQFTLREAQYARISVEQHTINVAVTVFGPDGKEVFKGDAWHIGTAEPAELVADMTGVYRLRVSAPQAKAPIGRYEISLRELETATERDKSRVAATRATAQAAMLSAMETREAQLQAVGSYEVALAHWQTAGDLFEQARTLYSIGLLYIMIGDRQKALDYTTRAVPVAQAARDSRAEAWALGAIGQVYDYFDDKRKAVEYYDQALPLMQAANDRLGEGNAYNQLGTAYLRLGEKRKAVGYLEQAMQIFGEVQDRYRQAIVANNIGVAYDDLGEYQRALERDQEALAMRRELEWSNGEALTLSNMGLVYLNLGEYQKALDALRAALDINRSLDNRRNAAVNLNNIAKVYASLGDRPRALRFFEEATEMLRAVKDQWGLTHTLNSLGEIYAESGDYRTSLTFHDEALSFARAVGDPDTEAAALNSIGNSYAKLGDRDTAREQFERALAVHRKAGNQRLLAGTLRNLSALHRDSHEYQRAMEYLDEAFNISRTIHDRNGEAAALAELSRLERDRGNLPAARERAEEALSAFEHLRSGVISPQLRASLFASVHQLQELNLQVLMRLHAERPEDGFGAAALLATERGRARSLLELLTESGTEIRNGVDATLLGRERELERLISGKAEQQTRLLNGIHTDAEAVAMEKELNALATELDQVQSRIRETSPQYAALTRPVPLDLKDIRAKVLDEDTVLLEYALGADKSFLWAVTLQSADIFELPSRAEIESAAKRVYELVMARNQKLQNETPAARTARVRQADEAFLAAATRVSNMLLGPAVARIGNKRLLIVAEGVLQYLPFAALPEPVPDAAGVANQSPLIANHEIVTVPSASVVAVLRRETAGRKQAPKTLAVLADPVFSADDARVAQQKNNTSAAAKDTAPPDAIQSATDLGLQDFVRLRFSRNEADEIVRLAPGQAILKALDFDASRDMVLNTDLGQYRIVHFATHSLLNNEHPELSGVVLSLVDRSGRPQNGFLRLYDIYNLRLASDLVVLSACQTALGGEIKGEGLIGLTRGFLYAGVPRVVASLWQIDDRTSAEMMKRFYQGMLARGERPAAALRAAQVAMWRTKGWEAPYYWAAFMLQGEWR
jgi:CHAT domain-containing protein/tetratricopeptide (TPR) repeat protein